MKKTEERVTEIINEYERINKENSKVKEFINFLKDTDIDEHMSKGSWVCNHCGSHNITCNFKTEVTGYGKPNVFGVAEIKDIKNAEISSIGDIITDLYWCEDCQKESRDINELAHWEPTTVEREAVVTVDEIKKISKSYSIDLNSMNGADYERYEKARDEYDLGELLSLYEKYPMSEPSIDGDEGDMPDLFEDSVPNEVNHITEYNYEIDGDKISNITSKIFSNK